MIGQLSDGPRVSRDGPRRNELSSILKTKTGAFVRNALLVEDTKRPCEVSGKLSIAWKLSNETLNAYMGAG